MSKSFKFNIFLETGVTKDEQVARLHRYWSKEWGFHPKKRELVLTKEEVLKNLYQFLHEIVHGMFGDNAECVQNAEGLMKEMEGQFATELSPHDNAANYVKTTYSEQMQDDLEPID